MLVDQNHGGRGGRSGGVVEQRVAEGHACRAGANHEVIARRWRFVARHCCRVLEKMSSLRFARLLLEATARPHNYSRSGAREGATMMSMSSWLKLQSAVAWECGFFERRATTLSVVVHMLIAR